MTFDLSNQMPRIGERAEVLVTWYLRFNGFFPLPNFILHDGGAKKSPGQQLTEADILAIRMPFTEEIISTPGETIHTAIDPRLCIRDRKAEFLIAETCSQDCKFNWLSKAEQEQQLFFSYAVRRFGFWPDTDVAAIVEHLTRDRIWDSGSTRLRLASFGIRRDPSAGLPGRIEQITLEETLSYLQRLFGCYGMRAASNEKYIVSDHHQWHPMIREVYARLLGHKVTRQNPSDVLRWLFPEATV